MKLRLTDLLWGGRGKPEPGGTPGCSARKRTHISSNKKRVLWKDMKEAVMRILLWEARITSKFNLMIKSEEVNSLSVSSHLGIVEFVTLDECFQTLFVHRKVENNERVYLVGFLCGLNEVIHMKHLEHCLTHRRRSITISFYHDLTSRQLFTFL